MIMYKKTQIITFFAILLSLLYCSNQSLSLNQYQFNFHAINTDDLNRGYVTTNLGSTHQPVKIRISPEIVGSWKLFIFADDIQAKAFGLYKSTSDIHWKRKNESDLNFHPLGIKKILLAEGKGDKDIFLDLKILLNWQDSPGDYNFTLNFMLEQNTKMKSRQKIIRKLEFGNQ